MARPKTSREPRMVERGLLCILIGAAVLIAPHFMKSPGFGDTLAGAHVVGWFAVVLGVALVAVDLFKHGKSR